MKYRLGVYKHFGLLAASDLLNDPVGGGQGQDHYSKCLGGGGRR